MKQVNYLITLTLVALFAMDEATLYKFEQNWGCDVQFTFIEPDAEPIRLVLHENFFYVYNLERPHYEPTILRPDLGLGIILLNDSCEVDYIGGSEDFPWPIVEYFQHKEQFIYSGQRCWKYYNNSNETIN